MSEVDYILQTLSAAPALLDVVEQAPVEIRDITVVSAEALSGMSADTEVMVLAWSLGFLEEGLTADDLLNAEVVEKGPTGEEHKDNTIRIPIGDGDEIYIRVMQERKLKKQNNGN